jgi:hypothetical protein
MILLDRILWDFLSASPAHLSPYHVALNRRDFLLKIEGVAVSDYPQFVRENHPPVPARKYP